MGYDNAAMKNMYQNGHPTIDVAALREQLEIFYDSLDTLELPRENRRTAQKATNRAIESTESHDARTDVVAGSLQEVGKAISDARVRIQAGSEVAVSVISVAKILGPLVQGGAQTVADWFGVPLS